MSAWIISVDTAYMTGQATIQCKIKDKREVQVEYIQ